MSKTEPSHHRLSKLTGIPRATIRDWLRPTYIAKNPMHLRPTTWDPGEMTPVQQATYAYLLGLYLGDGCISAHHRGVFHLRISLDNDYPQIIISCQQAIQLLFPHHTVSVYRSKDADYSEVGAYSKLWPTVFPQHGAGRKHLRKITLKRWQRRLVNLYPQQFLAGLMLSDGGRHDRYVDKHHYPFYQFTNMSTDIRNFFIATCKLLDVHYTTTGYRVNIATRKAVDYVDSFLGPKSGTPYIP